jgi:hypothetical protein
MLTYWRTFITLSVWDHWWRLKSNAGPFEFYAGTVTTRLLQTQYAVQVNQYTTNLKEDNFLTKGGLDDRDSRFRFSAGSGNFSLHHRVQNGSGVHPASYPMDSRGSFSGGEAAGAWSWQPPSSAEVKETSEAIHPHPQYTFMAWHLVKGQG